MNTSYFSSPKIIKKDIKLVSICRKTPNWFTVPHRNYKLLQPEYDLIMSYKSKKITAEEYTKIYYRDVLNKLDPAKTYQELGENSVLLCYEKSGEFCHRHLVGKWLMDNLGVIIMEL